MKYSNKISSKASWSCKVRRANHPYVIGTVPRQFDLIMGSLPVMSTSGRMGVYKIQSICYKVAPLPINILILVTESHFSFGPHSLLFKNFPSTLTLLYSILSIALNKYSFFSHLHLPHIYLNDYFSIYLCIRL